MNDSTCPLPATAPAARDAARTAERGFTLVEIMVVIVIIGILATLVVPNVIGASDEARIKTAQTNCIQIANAVRLYRTQIGRLPDDLEVLTGDDQKGKPWYLENLAKDPWDNDYQLVPGEKSSEFEVISMGPDRSEQTEDDISSKPKKED